MTYLCKAVRTHVQSARFKVEADSEEEAWEKADKVALDTEIEVTEVEEV